MTDTTFSTDPGRSPPGPGRTAQARGPTAGTVLDPHTVGIEQYEHGRSGRTRRERVSSGTSSFAIAPRQSANVAPRSLAPLPGPNEPVARADRRHRARTQLYKNPSEFLTSLLTQQL